MPSDEAPPGGRSGSLPWPFPPVLLPILLAWIAWSWWGEVHEQLLAAAETAPIAAPGAMAGFALGARALATLSEAGLYVLWWKGRGARLPYWRFACWVAALSAADLLAFALRRGVEAAPEFLRIAAATLAGPAALEPAPVADSGVMAAFGSLGALTLTRVGLTAWAQARGTGRTLRGSLLVTASAWLLSRLAGWWSFDLLRGLSPVR